MPVPDNGLDVLSFAECGLPDSHTLIELHFVLTNERTAVKKRLAEVHCLEERVHAAKDDSGAPHVVRAGLEEPTAERESFTGGTKRAKADCDSLAAHIYEREVAAATQNGYLVVAWQAVPSLKGRFAEGKENKNTAEARAPESLDIMSEFRTFVKGLSLTVGDERACVAGLIGTELILVLLVTTAALSESENKVREAILNKVDGFPVGASSGTARLSAWCSSDQALVSFVE